MERRDVVVSGFRLNATEQPTKVLQRLLGLDETQARALSKRFPSVVQSDQAWADAERLMLALRDAGAYAHLREPDGCSEPPAAVVAPHGAPSAGLATPPRPELDAMPEVRPAAAPPLAPPPAPQAAPVLQATAAPVVAQTLATAPTLFRSAGDEAARVSLYELGELEIVPSKGQPAPAMHRSEPAPSNVARSQPAPAPGVRSAPAPRMKSEPAVPPRSNKSEPAQRMRSEPVPPPRVNAEPGPPAATGTTVRSQPAPAPSKSQPAPPIDEALANGGLRMFGDSFGEETEQGASLELDEHALGPQTNRVEVQPWRQKPQAGARKRRGFFATLFLPLVLAQAAIPNALALTGVAAASGAAVYMVRRADQPMQDDVVPAEADNDKQVDQSDPPAKAQSAAAATHPLVRLAPAAMEGSIASILRTRFRGVHKVGVKWDEATKPKGNVECLLLDQAEAGNLKELASTGKVVPIPSEVREQLQDHILTLRTADAHPNAAYLPICLAN